MKIIIANKSKNGEAFCIFTAPPPPACTLAPGAWSLVPSVGWDCRVCKPSGDFSAARVDALCSLSAPARGADNSSNSPLTLDKTSIGDLPLYPRCSVPAAIGFDGGGWSERGVRCYYYSCGCNQAKCMILGMIC